jgi:choline-sulfatase
MNIVLLMADQLHADYVGYSDKSRMATPNIDRVAQSAGFINAVSTNPVCTPARCSLLTGRYPHQVGMMTMSGCLNPEYPTYAQALQKAGYYTAAIGKMHLLQGWHWFAPRGRGHDLVVLNDKLKEYGFDYVWEATGKGLMGRNYCDYAQYLDERGLLEKYRDELYRRAEIGHPEYPATSESFGIAEEHHVEVVIADRIISTIRQRPKDKPFMVFGSFLSPHPIIDPPERYVSTEALNSGEEFIVAEGGAPLEPELRARWIENRRGYRALVRLVDDQVGRILDALEAEGLMENTLIIFTADHGDLLGDFGKDGKNLPWRGSAGIPLAIRHPRHLSAQRVKAPVSLVDITATMLDVAGLNPRTSLALGWPAWNHVIPGRSLMPVLRGECGQVREYAFAENDGWEMIQTEHYKYVRWRTITPEYTPPKESFFDLDNDFREVHDLIGDGRYKDEAEWCRQRRDYEANRTPAGQMGWAPVGDRTHARVPVAVFEERAARGSKK